MNMAVGRLSLDEMEYLLKRAREQNEEYGVTGDLLQIDDHFMQYLEGPKDNLGIIYMSIQEDDQHTELILRSREAIENRQFGDWATAYKTIYFGGYVGSPSERKLIEMLLEFPKVKPTSARKVLHNFWCLSGPQRSLQLDRQTAAFSPTAPAFTDWRLKLAQR